MNKETSNKLNSDFIKEIVSTLERKNADYATDNDTLKNFKDAAKIAGITPQQGILFMIGIKTSRIGNLIAKSEDGKLPANEPILDSVLDCVGYTMLLRNALLDKE